MNKPLVSIIIPVYNVEEYLRECLDSVHNQTYKNLEIICIDDGSTDGSADILNEYQKKDNRIKLLSQSNAGQAAARNAGLQIATGKWVGGLDADDYLELDAIEKVIRHACQPVDVIQFSSRYFDATGKSKEPRINIQESGLIPITESHIIKCHPAFWDKLWKKELIDKCNIRFPVGLHFEDLAFTRCVLSMASAMYCIPDKLYVYRYRPGSTMERHRKRKGGRKILDYIQVADFCLNFWAQNKTREKFGYVLPSYLEMEIVRNIKDCISWWSANEFLHEAWLGIRQLIDKYNLGSRLVDFPDLALYYHIPSYALNRLQKNAEYKDTSGKFTIFLLSNYHRIAKNYRLAQIKSIFAWGKRRTQYIEKKKKLKELLRKARAARRESWNQLFK